jgi:two-component system chemotaxis response regulator CheY
MPTSESNLKLFGVTRTNTHKKGGDMVTIMVVDDAAFMRQRCAQLLIQSGYQVVEAANGAEAVAMYKQSTPNGVLLDITMPDMDGMQALQELIGIDPNARVAMVTAMGQQSIVIECLKAGAKDFVVKPFDADRVVAAVKKILG